MILVAPTPWELPHKLAARWQGPFEDIPAQNPSQVEYFQNGHTFVVSVKNVKHYIWVPTGTSLYLDTDEEKGGPGWLRYLDPGRDPPHPALFQTSPAHSWVELDEPDEWPPHWDPPWPVADAVAHATEGRRQPGAEAPPAPCQEEEPEPTAAVAQPEEDPPVTYEEASVQQPGTMNQSQDCPVDPGEDHTPAHLASGPVRSGESEC